MKRFISLLILLALSNTAASSEGYCMNPYLGVEAGLTKTQIQSLETGDKFKLNMMRPSFLAGLSINDNLAIEVGGYLTLRKTKDNVRFRTSSYFANLLGFAPVGNCVSLLGGVGMGHVRIKISEGEDSLSFRKPLPRVIAGAEYQHSEMISFRLTGVYENYRRIKNPTAKTRDSLSAHVGAIFSL